MMALKPHRNHKGYGAFLGHRLSGLALAVFLPLHFLTLGLALEGAAALDSLLAFTDLWIVKLAEWGLVILLALHFFFGMRVLTLELAPWPRTADNRADGRMGWILPGTIAAFFVGIVFLVQVI